MRSLAINDVTADYNVEVKLIDSKSRKVKDVIRKHNTGTFKLCDLITEALVGNNVASKIPGYIVPTTKVDNVYNNIFSFGIPYKEVSKSDDGSQSYSIATYTFLIESTFLSTGKTIDGFRLLSVKKSGTGREIMAEVQLDAPLNIAANTNIEVNWNINVRC